MTRPNRIPRTVRTVRSPGSFRFPAGRRRGLTPADVIVAVCLFLLLSGTALTAGLAGAREQANRVKCASNLKQIGQAALMYARNDHRAGAFPRTYWDTTSPKLIVDTTGYGKEVSFDRKVTGDNNVTASFFLILKTQEIEPVAFVCPSTNAVAGFGRGAKLGVQESSNWQAIPENLSYSYNCPFPTQKAVWNGWKFNPTLGKEFPLAADMNPGGDELTKLTANAPKAKMNAGNSRNHGGEGQNVLYCDGHVEFQPTPFCGPAAGNVQSRDNIYTYGGPDDKKGGEGVVGQPASPLDAVLLPTDAPAKPAGEKPAEQESAPPTGTPKGG